MKSFSQFQDIHTLIEDIDKIVEDLESKKGKKKKKNLELNLDFEEKIDINNSKPYIKLKEIVLILKHH